MKIEEAIKIIDHHIEKSETYLSYLDGHGPLQWWLESKRDINNLKEIKKILLCINTENQLQHASISTQAQKAKQ